jgi:hypothetical protein
MHTFISDAKVAEPAGAPSVSLIWIAFSVTGIVPALVMVTMLAGDSNVDPNGPTGLRASGALQVVGLAVAIVTLVQPFVASGDESTTTGVPAVIVWLLEVVLVKTAWAPAPMRPKPAVPIAPIIAILRNLSSFMSVHAPWLDVVIRQGHRVRHSLPTGPATKLVL